jgi:DMSO/TMAO reductase YedYZ molybdopterin-dependent catalytic subunit
MRPEARFVVFHCADELPLYLYGADLYYESLDLIDPLHPQTILAHAGYWEDEGYQWYAGI